MKIYIASKVKHAPKWLALRDRGAPIISTWIDEWQPGASKDVSDLWLRCVEEAHWADFLIAYREKGEHFKGALVEIGAALSAGASVILVGDFSQDEVGRWMAHPLVGTRPSVEDALESIGVKLQQSTSQDAQGQRTASPSERRALGLYVVLARDQCDFLDMVLETDTETLGILLDMLTKENPSFDEPTLELNAIGAKVVRGELRAREAT
jgi:hypothetical protein